jgi:hypothetical protein
MSYKCETCGATCDHGILRRVVETRPAVYPPREYWNGKRDVRDPGGFGTEIVRELQLCRKHADAVDVLVEALAKSGGPTVEIVNQ